MHGKTSLADMMGDPSPDWHWRVQYEGQLLVGDSCEAATEMMRAAALVEVIVARGVGQRELRLSPGDRENRAYDEYAVTN